MPGMDAKVVGDDVVITVDYLIMHTSWQGLFPMQYEIYAV